MIYDDFNTFIRDEFFCSKNKGSHVVLSVDQSIIEKFCNENNTSEQELRKEFQRLFSEHWNYALEDENFFGLAAIQVYVAHQMGEGDGYTSKMYNPRLTDILKRNDEQSFNIELIYEKYQDQLWLKLKMWCKENGYFIEIPNIGKNKGRYIQYPLSQSLLNQDDLKYLPNLYCNAGLSPFEQFCLDDFWGLVEKAEINVFLPDHFKKVKERLKKDGNEKPLYEQMFEHYSNWDGQIIFEDETEKRIAHKQIFNNEDTLLVFSQEQQEIQIFNNQNVLSRFSINTRDVFQRIKKHIKLPFKNILFFIKDEHYGDWKFSRYLVKGEQNLMISTNDEPLEYHAKRIDANCQITNKLSCVITILRISDDYKPNSFWENYFPKVSLHVKIKNGLKLDRKRWMHQAGPDLIFSKPVDAWVNGEKITTTEESPIISLRYCETGSYVLKLRGFSPIRIEIDNPTFENQEVLNGWHISKKPAVWEPKAEAFQICGLQNSFITEQDSTSEIRNWIDVNTNRTKTTKNLYSNQVTNALKRAKNGI